VGLNCGTTLQGAIFNAANPAWTGTRLSGTLSPPLLGANLRGVNFRSADLRGPGLTGADFSEAFSAVLAAPDIFNRTKIYEH